MFEDGSPLAIWIMGGVVVIGMVAMVLSAID